MYQNDHTTTSTPTAIIVKVGNSYGIRLPRDYMRKYNLKPGDSMRLPAKPKPGDVSGVLTKITQYIKDNPQAGASIPDPVAWQRQQRRASNPWEQL